ncbi:MAG: hypothetical protein RQ966_08645 [Acetobacteraceae bacterium]|nr:hypothetical protein [Acetobacteraceae bacterium]
MRRLTDSLPGMLVAALVLFARLVAPAMAMPNDFGGPAIPICHAAASGKAPGSTDHPGQHECLLCPACHLVAHAALPMPASPGVPVPTLAAIGIAAPLPPATGPPSAIRATAQPTGPPSLSA